MRLYHLDVLRKCSVHINQITNYYLNLKFQNHMIHFVNKMIKSLKSGGVLTLKLFCRAFFFSYLEVQEKISVTLAEVISGLRLIFCFVEIPAPASHSCFSMFITWFQEDSIHLEKALVLLVLQHM